VCVLDAAGKSMGGTDDRPEEGYFSGAGTRSTTELRLASGTYTVLVEQLNWDKLEFIIRCARARVLGHVKEEGRVVLLTCSCCSFVLACMCAAPISAWKAVIRRAASLGRPLVLTKGEMTFRSSSCRITRPNICRFVKGERELKGETRD
jgi:hypothetical protein